jgi:MoxR-like ATPase
VAIQTAADAVHSSDNLLDYVQRLVEDTRSNTEYVLGLSPRGALALLRCAKTWALMAGRGHVVPEDVQMVLPSVVEHRLQTSLDYQTAGRGLSQKLLENVPVIV